MRKAEATMGVAFPRDFVEFYSIHDGQPRDSGGLINGMTLSCLDRIIFNWKVLTELLEQGDFRTAKSRPDGPSKGREVIYSAGAHDGLMHVKMPESIVPVPKYLLTDPAYHGGADHQFAIPDDDESKATPAGWIARRWDPAVRERWAAVLRQTIDACALLGVDVAVVYGGSCAGMYFYGLPAVGPDDPSNMVDANLRLGFADDERDFSVAARMLEKLGQRRIRLLTNNPKKVTTLETAGVEVAGRVPLKAGAGTHNQAYLDTKRDRSGHQL